MNLNIPEDGKTYAIGAHYWGDHGYGVSKATIRVYVLSALVYEVEQVERTNRDMWWAASLEWPSAKITPKLQEGGELWIHGPYDNANFQGF